MSPNFYQALFVGIGLAVNATWSVFNARLAPQIKEWVRQNYYDQKFLDQRHAEIERRLTAAGA